MDKRLAESNVTNAKVTSNKIRASCIFDGLVKLLQRKVFAIFFSEQIWTVKINYFGQPNTTLFIFVEVATSQKMFWDLFTFSDSFPLPQVNQN